MEAIVTSVRQTAAQSSLMCGDECRTVAAADLAADEDARGVVRGGRQAQGCRTPVAHEALRAPLA